MPDMEKVIEELEDSRRLLAPQINAKYHRNRLELMIKGIEDALDLLKEQGWKLITEDSDGILHGLPGDDGTYLMTDGKDIWIDEYVDGVDDGIFLDSGRDIREIKAWMYMPELPK